MKGNTINSDDVNLEFEKQKEITKLMHQMEDGQITEDEFNEEVLKLQNIISEKNKKQLVDIKYIKSYRENVISQNVYFIKKPRNIEHKIKFLNNKVEDCYE